jgi:hypothetical protein
VGVVRLAAAVPREFAFQPTQSVGTGLVGEFLDLTGYPGARNGEMWRDHDQVAGVELTTNTLLFTHDTLPGSSGSPVYLYDARVYCFTLGGTFSELPAGQMQGALAQEGQAPFQASATDGSPAGSPPKAP